MQKKDGILDNRTTKRLGVILAANLLSAKCANCHVRYVERKEENKEGWCQRCKNVWRQSKLADCAKLNIILAQVGDGYIDADMSHLEALEDMLLKLTGTQDLFLWGSIGTGKTYAMAALLKHYVFQGYFCIRINFDEFCTDLRSTFSSASKVSESEMIRPLMDIDKLFIDDLGMRFKQETDFAFITFYTILNKRQERLLPTYITTNHSIDELEQKFDARIASRLRTAMNIQLTGKDRRLTYSK